MQTNYQLPVPELYQAGTFFANLGLECPWVDGWCDLGSGYVYDEGNTRSANHPKKPNTVSDAYCPPAVAAAVVDFAEDVAALWNKDYEYSHGARGAFGWGRFSKWCPDSDDHVYDGDGWWWCILVGDVPNRCGSKIEAAVALILGVYEAMGGE